MNSILQVFTTTNTAPQYPDPLPSKPYNNTLLSTGIGCGIIIGLLFALVVKQIRKIQVKAV